MFEKWLPFIAIFVVGVVAVSVVRDHFRLRDALQTLQPVQK